MYNQPGEGLGEWGQLTPVQQPLAFCKPTLLPDLAFFPHKKQKLQIFMRNILIFKYWQLICLNA